MIFNPLAHIDGLVQERRNSIANALKLRLSCINPSIWDINLVIFEPTDDLPLAGTMLTTML